MGTKLKNELKWSDVTPKEQFLNRRSIIAGAAAMGGAAALAGLPGQAQAKKLDFVPSEYSTDDKPNSFEDITNYNNFYEFGIRKDDPAKYAQELTTDPWSVVIDGMVDNPGTCLLYTSPSPRDS